MQIMQEADFHESGPAIGIVCMKSVVKTHMIFNFIALASFFLLPGSIIHCAMRKSTDAYTIDEFVEE
jgi:hypothetical protein